MLRNSNTVGFADIVFGLGNPGDMPIAGDWDGVLDHSNLRSLIENAKQDFEREYLVQLVELTGGNVSQAAKLSGKHRADLYELLKKHDIDPQNYRK